MWWFGVLCWSNFDIDKMFNVNLKIMKRKNLTIVFVAFAVLTAGLLFAAASKTNDKKEISKFLASARVSFDKSDYNAWASHWKQSENALVTITSMESNEILQGWNAIKGKAKPMFDNRKKVGNTKGQHLADFTINSIVADNNIAWVNATATRSVKSGEAPFENRYYTLQRIKGDWKIVGINIIKSSSYAEGKFVVDANKTPEVTHVHLDDFPKDKVFPMIEGWGGMCVDINTAPAGTNFTPLLEGLPNDHCQVPHWGYIVKGAIRMEYEDGTKEVIRAGEAFYMKPGHTGGVEEDLLLVSFGPEEGIKHLVEHFDKKVAAMQAEHQHE